MQDDVFSAAVVIYVWGDPRRSWPSPSPDVVRRQFGDQAENLLLRIDELLTEVYQMSPDADLATSGHRVQEALQLSHPELTDEARKALAAKYTYDWR